MKSQFQKDTEKQLARMSPQFIQQAVVKDNRDPKKMGRLKVWIDGSASAEDNKSGWITAEYASPFAGRTQGQPNAETYADHPKSYGFWATPPDVNATVFVFFVNGRIEQAYWFGSPFDYMMNGMVPGPQTKVVAESGIDSPLPVVEFDRNTQQTSTEAEYLNVPLIDGLTKQKLLYDEDKGVPNRSARRQAPATVYGMSSPRGNHLVIDDGFTEDELTAKTWDDDQDGFQETEYGNPINNTETGSRKNEGVVLRTRSGAQIILSESDGYVFVINRDGTGRVEIDENGRISVIGDEDICLRAKRDINYYAERDMNIEVLRNMNIKVHGIHKTQVIGKTVAHHQDEVVLKLDKSLRVSVADDIRAKAAKTLSLEAGSAAILESGSQLSLKGSSAVAMDGGGGLATLSGDFSASGSIKAGGDVKTATASLSFHIHGGVKGGPSKTAPAESGGGAGSPSSTTAPLAADDIEVEEFELTTISDVVSVSADAPIATKIANEIDQATDASLSTLGFVMPTSGTVSKTMYWGTNIKQPDGSTIDSSGWVIDGSSSIVSIAKGYILNVTNTTVHIDHKNGYHSLYKGITSSDSLSQGDEVDAGASIGNFEREFLFEIRKSGSPIFGFKGSVDPGLFYIEQTQTGASAAGASLSSGTATNPVCASTSAATVSDIVNTVDFETILSNMAQSGFAVKPSTKSSSTNELGAKDTLNVVLPDAELIEPFSPEPVEWIVESSDQALVDTVKESEGTIEYQKELGYYKDGQFFVYKDSENYDTIGYGHLVLASESFTSLSEADADALLVKDLTEAVAGAKSIATSHRMRLPKVGQEVLSEMVFQLGKPGTLQFKKFLTALRKKDFKQAAEEMRDSLWYQQTPNRVEKHAKRIEKL